MTEEVLALSTWKTFVAILINRCGMPMNFSKYTYITYDSLAVNLVAKTNSIVADCY